MARTCSAPSHNVKQLLHIVNCIIWKQFQWSLVQNDYHTRFRFLFRPQMNCGNVNVYLLITLLEIYPYTIIFLCWYVFVFWIVSGKARRHTQPCGYWCHDAEGPRHQCPWRICTYHFCLEEAWSYWDLFMFFNMRVCLYAYVYIYIYICTPFFHTKIEQVGEILPPGRQIKYLDCCYPTTGRSSTDTISIYFVRNTPSPTMCIWSNSNEFISERVRWW